MAGPHIGSGPMIGSGPSLGAPAVRRRALNQEFSYGVTGIVGAFGAGKTLLGVTLAHPYATRTCKGNDCRDGECSAENPTPWKVYTNIPSTWDEQYGAWALPINFMEQFYVEKRVPDHSVFLIDEGDRYMDSRKWMSKETSEFLDVVFQLRKSTTKMFITSPSYDFFDARFRRVMRYLYNIWTPDEGTNVLAEIHKLADPSVPPSKKHVVRPLRKGWHTAPFRRYYNTDDHIKASDDMVAGAKEPVVYINVGGELHEQKVSDLVANTAMMLAQEGVASVPEQALIELMASDYGVTVSVGAVRRALSQKGFPYQNGRFQLLAKREGG